MDPNQTIYNIVDNLLFLQVSNPEYTKEEREDSRNELADGLRNLAGWIEHGGFIPTVKVYIKD